MTALKALTRITSLAAPSLITVALLALPADLKAQTPAGTGFNYQGRIKQNGSLMSDKVDFQFKLYDAASGGAQVGSTVTIVADPNPLVPNNVDKGLFNATIDFGANAFDGDARWLELAVRYPSQPGGGSLGFVTVSPRQALNPAPYAITSTNGGGWFIAGNDSIHMNGNVGINYANPGQELSIVNSPGENEAVLELGTLGVGGVDFFLIASNADAPVPSSFRIYNNFGNSDALTINAITDNVGIGTNDPQFTLDVAGPMNVSSQVKAWEFRMDDPSNSPELIIVRPAGSWRVGAPHGGADFRVTWDIFTNPFRIEQNAPDHTLILTANGDVGIGTSNPTSKLHINGCVTATNTAACSDARFKKDIHPVSDALESILQLQGVRFAWRTDEFPDRGFEIGSQVGFIAQEVRQIIPEIVLEGTDGYMSVDYARLAPVLVEAIKDLHSQAQEKDARLAAQQSQIDSLTARLQAIEARLAR